MAGLQAYVFGAYVLIGSTLYNYLTGNIAVQYEGRYSATGINANDVALILILGMPIGLPIAMQLLFVTQKNITGTLLQVMDILYIPLSIFAIFLTGSRTSLIAVVPFIVFIIATQRIKIERKILIFALLLFSILTLLPFVPQSLITRLGTIGNSISGADLGGRVTCGGKVLWYSPNSQYWVLAVVPSIAQLAGLFTIHLYPLQRKRVSSAWYCFSPFLDWLSMIWSDCPERTSGLWLAIFATWAIGAVSLSWEFRKLTWIILNFIMTESNFGKQVGEQTGRSASREK